MVSQAELERYNRQLILPELGLTGQERLKRARALIVGAGGLGSPAALYMAAAGVGHLTLVDSDVVEASNLHRQVLHGTADVGRPKVESAGDCLRRLNPHVAVTSRGIRVDTSNARDVIAGHDIVVDGSDNYATRYAINDACAAASIPWVYGSVERFSGQVAAFGVNGGPCYRCVYPEAPRPGSTASCEEIGVLGAVPGVVGSMQAVAALKILAGIESPDGSQLVQIDLLRGGFRSITIVRRPDCPACGRLSPHHASQQMNRSEPELPPFNIDPREVQPRLAQAAAQLLDIREPWEVQRASIAGAVLMPMSTLEDNVSQFDRSTEVIVFCHHGSRSRVAAEWLREQGIPARNMTGGIDRWSREVDTSVPRY